MFLYKACKTYYIEAISICKDCCYWQQIFNNNNIFSISLDQDETKKKVL